MSKLTIIALANAASALATAAAALAEEFSEETTVAVHTTAFVPEEAPVAKRRGRPPGSKNTPVVAPEETPEPELQPEAPAVTEADQEVSMVPVPTEKLEASLPTGKTYEELKALIEKPVKEGHGAQVKQIIAKYVGPDEVLKDLPKYPQHHAAFEKDLGALGY